MPGPVPQPNWIGGRWSPASSGAGFERGGEHWAQSGPQDLRAALAPGNGTTRSPLTAARALWGAFHEGPAGRDGLARALGLDASEQHELPRDCEGIDGAWLTRPRPVEAGTTLVLGDWRRGAGGLLEDVLEALLRGRQVVALPDPRVPDLGLRLALAAERAELESELTVLFGAPRELCALALAESAPGSLALTAAGPVARRIEWRRQCEAQGVSAVRLVPLRVSVLEVWPEGDLQSQARSAVEAAFGRGRTLSGQLSGSLARVHCPAPAFSRFSEALLAALEGARAGREPLPQIDTEAVSAARSACALGLDEGATLIFGGEAAQGDDPRVLTPMVFTNVEPRMACARRQDPLPVLCLLRQT